MNKILLYRKCHICGSNLTPLAKLFGENVSLNIIRVCSNHRCFRSVNTRIVKSWIPTKEVPVVSINNEEDEDGDI